MTVAAKGTVLQLGNGATPEKFLTIANVVSISGPTISHEVIDVTDLEDDAAQYIASAVMDGGEITLELNFEADDSTHDAVADDVIAGATHNYQLCFGDFGARALAFVAGDVNVGAETIAEAGHGLTYGQPVKISTDDTMPAPLVAGTTYYVIWVDANTIQLCATNPAGILAGTAINLTSQGVGNHSIDAGSRYSVALYPTAMTPSGTTGDKLSASVTFKATGTVTISI